MFTVNRKGYKRFFFEEKIELNSAGFSFNFQLVKTVVKNHKIKTI